ncbi:MAG: hypothetical protein JSS86_01080 [Cyanobacteria bacterium SZAS LIN-2]|nr:hypothetical protein [Cyanobacteria bacterium SZAS LIN-2]
MKNAQRAARKNFAANRIGIMSAGFNIALFTTCSQALAHGSGSTWAAGHSVVSPTNALHNQNWGGTQGSSITQPVVPHAFTPTAATLPIAAPAAFIPQHQNHVSTTHENSWQQAFARPTLIQLPTAQTATGAEQNIQLDLTSSNSSIVLQPGIISHSPSVTISLDGTTSTFHTGDKVTPAELVAIYQAQSSGGQQIVLDSEGRAQGGSFSLNSVLSLNHFVQVNGVVVPQNVTAFDYALGKSSISVGGDLLNYGSIIGVSGSHASANIVATNIINESSGTISTVAHGAHSGVVDLALDAAKDFTNLGAISSSGKLAISAGGTLTNGVVGGTSAGGVRPTLTAVGDINLQAPHIVNTGLVSSTAGNVTLGAAPGFDLSVNNSQGTISALSGAINVRDAAYTGVSNSTFTGGDLLSKQLNLHAGGGTVNVNVEQLTGNVESDGSAVHVSANTDMLHVGTQCLTGDPTYYNTGDIQLNGSITATEAITILAGGNITASGLSKIEARDAGGQGYNITIIAGAPGLKSSGSGDSTTGVQTPGTAANGTVSFNQPVSINAVGTGGYIDLSGASSSMQINSNSTKAGLDGGNIFIGAYGNAPANGGEVNSGMITLRTGGTINASAGAGGTGGVVGIYSGCRTSGATAITVGSISGASTVHIQVQTPEPIGTTNWSFGTNGAQGPGTGMQGSLNLGIGQGGINLAGPINASGAVTILGGNGGDTISLGGAITTNGPATLATTGSINLLAGISASAGIAIVAGGDVAAGGSVGNTLKTNTVAGIPGDITILAGEQYTFNTVKITTNPLVHSTTGGRVELASTFDSISTVSNTTDGNGGNITIGAASGSNAFTGQVLISPVNVLSGGNGKGSNGNITIYGTAASAGVTIDAGSNATVSTAGGSKPSGSVDIEAAKYTSSIIIDTTNGAQTGNLTLGQTVVGTIAGPLNLIGGGGDVKIATGAALNNSTNYTGSINELFIEGFGITTPTVNAGIVNNFTAWAPSGNITIGSDIKVSNNIQILAQGLSSGINIGKGTIQAGTGGILMVAGGTIATTASGGSILTSATSDAGNITIIAGVNYGFNPSPPRTVALFSSTTNGGDINFAAQPLSQLSAESTSGTGGTVNLIAFQGNTATTGVVLPGALTLKADSLSKNGGSVVAVADAGIGGALNSFNANATGAGGNSTITLSVSTPNLGSASLDPMTSTVSGSFLGGSLTSGKLWAGTLAATDSVTAQAGGSVSLGPVSAQRILAVSTAGDVSVNGSLQADQTNFAMAGGIVLAAGGSVTTSGGGVSANAAVLGTNAGSITMLAGANISVAADGSSITINGSSNIPGNITVSATSITTTNKFTGLGGKITAIAYSAIGDPVNTGRVSISAPGPMDTSGKSANGDVLIVAGSTDTANAIKLPGINIAGAPGSGNVLISSSSTANTVIIATTPANFGLAFGSFVGGPVSGGGTAMSNLGNITVTGGRVEIHQTSDAIFNTSTILGTPSNILVESSGNIQLNAAFSADSISLISGNTITLNGPSLKAPSGLLLVAAADIKATTATAISTSSNTDAGPLSMFAGTASSVAVGVSGDIISVTGPSAGGGSIDLTSIGSLSSKSTDTGAGGNMTFVAFTDSLGVKGQILINSALTLQTNGTVAGRNGSFIAVGGAKQTAISIGNVDTTGGGSNIGQATITLQAAAPGIPTNGNVTYDQTGKQLNSVSVLNADPSSGAITHGDILTGNLTNTGGDITVFSSRKVQLGNLDSSAPVSATFGAGNITVTTYDGFTLFVGAVPADGKQNYMGTVKATSAGAFANGNVSISHLDPGGLDVGGITLMGANVISNTGNVGGGGLTLIAGSAPSEIIDLGANTTFNYNASAVGGTKANAGTITMKGADIVWTGKGTTPLTLTANASADGKAGAIDFEVHDGGQLDLGKSGPLFFSAKGAVGNASAGSIILQNGGGSAGASVTYDPTSTALDLTPASGGSGGKLTLKSGYFDDFEINQNSTLLITGSLSENGQSGGGGGQITLAATSPTVFNIGQIAGNKNGVQGTLSVSGSPNGALTVQSGGGIITNAPITAVADLSLRSSGVGSITIGGALGTPGATIDAFLIVDQGSIIQLNKAFVVSANEVLLETGSGAGFNIGTSKAAFVVNADRLTAQAGDTVNINATGTGPRLIGTNSAELGSYTLVTTAAGGINSDSSPPAFSLSAGTNVTLTAPSIDLEGNVKAGGIALLTATTGNFKSTGDVSATTVTITAAKGTANIGSVGLSKTQAVSALSITAANGITADSDIQTKDSVTLKTTSTKVGGISLFTQVAASAPTGVVNINAGFGDVNVVNGDVSGGKSVTITAGKGIIDVQSIGNSPTGTVTLTSGSDPSGAGSKIQIGNGGITAATSIILKTTSTKDGFIAVAGNLKTTNLAPSTGVISVISAGDVELDTSKSVEATKSITITSSKSHAFMGKLGNGVQGADTVTITAAKDIQVAAINAINTVTIKGTTSSSDITISGDVLASSPTKGVVSITAPGFSGIDATGHDVSGGKSVSLTAANGKIALGTGGKVLAPLTLALTASGPITASGDLKAVNSITAKTTTKSTSSGAGEINFGGDVLTSSTTAGVVTLTSSGAGAAITLPAAHKVLATKSVTMTASAGDVVVGTIGLPVSPSATIAITALKSLTVNGDLTASKSVTLKTTGKAAGQGDIFVHGNILAFSKTGTVAITSSSIGTGIVVDTNKDISACTSVTLTAAKANITTGSVGADGTHLTAKAVMTALNNITTNGTITVQSSDSETVTGATGAITANANIRAMPLASPFTSGTVTLTASQGLIDAKNADITGGKSVTLSAAKGVGTIDIKSVGAVDPSGTFVAKSLHGFKNIGSINTVGAVAITTGTSSSLTDGVDLAGNITTTAGAISVTSGGTFLTVEPGVAITANGTSKVKAPILLLDTNKTNSLISFGNGSSVTTGGAGGDTITVAIGTAPTKGVNTTNPNVAGIKINPNTPGNNAFFGPVGVVDPTSTGTITLQGANVIFSGPTSPAQPFIKFTNTTFFADPPVSTAAAPSVHLINTGISSALNQVTLQPVTAPATLQSTTLAQTARTASQITTADVASLVSLRVLSAPKFNWISATEVDGGEIPVSLLADEELTISSADVAQIQHQSQHKLSHLSRGSVLSIARADRKITTAFGDVNIAANSMVLVMAFDHGMAVYNFDDTHPNAVTVTAGGKAIAVHPGTSTLITASHVKSFEQVNPAQLVFYRRMVEHELDGNLKAYRSEFSIRSAMHAVRPLRELLVARDKETSRVANHFLKTTAILMQMQSGGEGFRQMMKPRLTASAVVAGQ